MTQTKITENTPDTLHEYNSIIKPNFKHFKECILPNITTIFDSRNWLVIKHIHTFAGNDIYVIYTNIDLNYTINDANIDNLNFLGSPHFTRENTYIKTFDDVNSKIPYTSWKYEYKLYYTL